MTNKTTYKAIFESKDIATQDARKMIAVQTVIGSNDTITTNVLLKFTSDVKKDNAYIKALAFNLDNNGMEELIKALASAQTAKLVEEKAKPQLKARQETASKVITIVDDSVKREVLKGVGMSDEQIDAVLKTQKTATKTKKPTAKTAKAVENDIFTLSFMASPKKGGVK